MSAHTGSTNRVDPNIHSLEILKYPRTPHLEGSRLQPGDLLYAYDANVRLVYLEVPARVLFQRNGERETTLTQKALERMLHRWEAPLPWEAHELRCEVAVGE